LEKPSCGGSASSGQRMTMGYSPPSPGPGAGPVAGAEPGPGAGAGAGGGRRPRAGGGAGGGGGGGGGGRGGGGGGGVGAGGGGGGGGGGGQGGGQEVVQPLDEGGEGGGVVEHPFGVAGVFQEAQLFGRAGVAVEGLGFDGFVEVVVCAVDDQQRAGGDLVGDAVGGEPQQVVGGFEGDAAAGARGLVQFGADVPVGAGV